MRKNALKMRKKCAPIEKIGKIDIDEKKFRARFAGKYHVISPNFGLLVDLTLVNIIFSHNMHIMMSKNGEFHDKTFFVPS